MDSLDLFFKRYSYKFDKGYPDMNNKQDVLLLESLFENLGFDLELTELTVSSKYQSKGVFNPFYVLDPEVDKKVRDLLNDKDISFDNVIYKAVDSIDEDPILSTGQTPFELFTDEDTSLNVFIKIPKNKVKAHYGQKTRKDSTASSNVNEFLSLYFLRHPEFKSVEDLKNKEGGTGVLTGEGEEISYSQLIDMINRDETPDRDIKIGINNAKALKQDLKDTSYKTLYWTPRQKPANINPKNPSDIIIQLSDDSFIGYSNKIIVGKDATPKFNTNIVAFFSKLGGSQSEDIKQIIDNAWEEAAKKVPSSATNAKKAIKSFDIKGEEYSESKSQRAFADLAIEFQKDNLEFFGKDFYYNFRNNLISSVSKYLESPENLKYFLNTIAGYTYGASVEGETPCPYKLLIGSESGSTIKDVSENQDLKSIVTINNSKDIKDIKNSYDGTSQSFTINFKTKIKNELKSISIPVTVRTRASGGWSGKSLYITSSGIKIN
jgi:hypothetical protein